MSDTLAFYELAVTFGKRAWSGPMMVMRKIWRSHSTAKDHPTWQ